MKSTAVSEFENIKNLCHDDMQAVNQLILDRLKSDVALVNQLGLYIIGAGGKRLRPILAVLSARALGYEGRAHHLLAAIVEFIHTATLLHDDVVDESQMRRGQETANAMFGNQASVLVGDYLYTRAFQMMVELDSAKVMRVFSDTTNVIAEGEVRQLMHVNNPDVTELDYMKVIHAKTGVLFAAATGLAAEIAGYSEQFDALYAYGLHLGQAFQLADDALDYISDSDTLGKNVGDDLAEGKPTLPLIYAQQKGTEAQRHLIRQAIQNGGRENLGDVLNVIEATGAITYTIEKAQSEAQKAINALATLPDNQYKEALARLARFAVSRRS